MIRPPDDLTSAIVLLANKDLINKLFGPTAEYFGDGMRKLVECGNKNMARIVQSAITRLGSKLESPGTVPSRVLKEVMIEGAFIEDELTLEYFGGVLASSRSESGRDDRAVSMLSLLKRLSSYQVRAHYVIYRVVRAKTYFMEHGARMLRVPGTFAMDRDEFIQVMAFDSHEVEKYDALVEHIVIGLTREDLVTQAGYWNGRPHASGCSTGVELFLWAHGLGDRQVEEFYNPDLDLGMPVTFPGLA